MEQHVNVVIIGGGFAGVQAAKALARRAPAARVLLLDRNNYHTFTPLLYQVATAAIQPEDIAYPIRSILRRMRNVAFRLTEVSDVDLERRTVQTDDGSISYDYVIFAAGSTTNFFGTDGAQDHSFGLKDLSEAIALRNHLLGTVERAAAEADVAKRSRLLTVVIVGGGPTGVEMAGAVTELVRLMIRHDYPMLDPAEVQVLLVEAGPRLLGGFQPKLGDAALRYLRRNGVDVRLGQAVKVVDESGVSLSTGESIETPTVVWAAGVEARGLVPGLTPAPHANNRLAVLPTLQLEGHPQVYVAGDMAALRQGNALLPMLAPVGMQQGRCAGENVAEQLAGRAPKPFRYVDRGVMATLGRSNAVAQIGPVTLSGFIAWLAWLGLHIVDLVGFRNRALVLVNWIWDYFFLTSGARVIIAADKKSDSD
jgi:NADH dehydrogenase